MLLPKSDSRPKATVAQTRQFAEPPFRLKPLKNKQTPIPSGMECGLPYRRVMNATAQSKPSIEREIASTISNSDRFIEASTVMISVSSAIPDDFTKMISIASGMKSAGETVFSIPQMIIAVTATILSVTDRLLSVPDQIVCDAARILSVTEIIMFGTEMIL